MRRRRRFHHRTTVVGTDYFLGDDANGAVGVCGDAVNRK